MSKKKQKAPKGNVIWHQSAEEATLAKKPRYNGFACGHGAHGDTKYNRTKAKRTWKQQLRQEGASRGSFSFLMILGCIWLALSYPPILQPTINRVSIQSDIAI